MSRDFTPLEIFVADREYKFDDIWLIKPSGEKFLLGSSKELKKRYPKLGLLFSEKLEELVNVLAKEKREVLLQNVEDILCELTKLTEQSISTDGSLKPFENETILHRIVFLWYIGCLDEGFYYHERNDEMLFDILTQIPQKTLTQLYEKNTNVLEHPAVKALFS